MIASDKSLTFSAGDYCREVDNGDSTHGVDAHNTPNTVVVEQVYALTLGSLDQLTQRVVSVDREVLVGLVGGQISCRRALDVGDLS